MRSSSVNLTAWMMITAILGAVLACIFSLGAQDDVGEHGIWPVVRARHLSVRDQDPPSKKDESPCKYKEDCGNIV